MFKPALSTDEREVLGSYFLKSPITLIRLKAQAVLMRDRGLKQKTISELVFRSERTIQRWVGDFSKRRMASLFSGHVDNENASKLTKKQKEQIRKVLKKPPSDYDLPKKFWDVPTLRNYIKAEFGVVYESSQSYHFLLKFSELSFKYPAKHSIRRNEQKIQKRMVEIRKEIKPYLEDPQWEVFAADETRIVLEAVTRRAWLKRGKKTVVKVERGNEYQSYLGFLNQRNFKCHLYQLPWQNQKEIIKVFKIFLKRYPSKRICVVWDNAGFHRGKLIRQELRKGGLLERVHLIALPPYAPDMNPIEHVWGWAKGKVANQQYRDFKFTKHRFRQAIHSRSFDYRI